jgi:ubiquinone/menaquinone biosynthesis C-methylase UbiE
MRLADGDDRGKQMDLIESTYWDDIVSLYEALYEPLSRQHAGAVLSMLEMGEESKVLDVAAGTGSLALLAAGSGARVLAVDTSAAMLSRIPARAAPTMHIDTQVMDGQMLDLPDAHFDLSFSMFGLMFFPDWRKGLAELARVTREGGRGGITVWEHHYGAGPFVLLYEAWKLAFPAKGEMETPDGLKVLSSPATLVKEMNAAGFHEVTLRLNTGTWAGPDASAFGSHLERFFGGLPMYRQLEKSERDKLDHEIRLAAGRYATKEGLAVPSNAWIAVGTKTRPIAAGSTKTHEPVR